MVKYTNEFQHLCSRTTKFPISTSDKVERFISRLKDNVRNKVVVDLKGDGSPWEDIKCLIHYAVTFNVTYAQIANGKDTKSRFDTM